MTHTPNTIQDDEKLYQLNLYRFLLLLAGVFYPLWSFVSQASIPEGYDPLLERVLFGGFCILMAALTYAHAFFKKHVESILNITAWGMTAHYFSIIYRNPQSSVYMAGAFIVIFVITVCLPSRAPFLAYTVFVLGLSVWISLVNTTFPSHFFLAGVATILIISYTVVLSRLKRMKSIKESEERFRSMADSAPLMIWMSDGRGHRNFFNQGWLEYTGRTIDQEMQDGWIEGLHIKDRRVYFDSSHEAFRKYQKLTVEYRLMRANGEYGWIFEQAVPRFFQEGTFAGYIGTCIDVTERKTAESELQTKTEELTHANKELEELAYVISHDLQASLRKVGEAADFLTKNYKNQLDPQASGPIDLIVGNIHKIRQLLNDLLMYSRVKRGALSLEEVDFEGLFDEVVRRLETEVLKSNVTITHHPLPVLSANKIQMSELLQNLIGIAIKFADKKEPKVHLRAEHRSGEWLFAVHNNGLGVKPEMLEKIFSVAKKLVETEDYTGTGIGLVICRKIAERHGGRMWVEAVPGKGSTFFFTLPVHPVGNHQKL